MNTVRTASLTRGFPTTLVYLALTTVFGLQMLRLLMEGLVFYLRDAHEASLLTVGGVGAAVFLAGFASPGLERALGLQKARAMTSGGLGVIRLGEQLTATPAADFSLSILGSLLFLWSIPLSFAYLSRPGTGRPGDWGIGLLLGVAIDTTVKGAFRTLDLSWQTGAGADALATALAFIQLGALWYDIKTKPKEDAGPHYSESPLPLLAAGPFLAVELLFFQNIGQQTVLIDWPQPAVFTWTTMANVGGIAAALALRGRAIPRYVILALGALVVLALVSEQSGGLAAVIALLGHIALASLLVSRAGPLARASNSPGVVRVAVASGVGMILFLILVFVYYASFDIGLPASRDVIPPLAAGIVALISMWRPSPGGERLRPAPAAWVAGLSALLMVGPLAYFLAWDEPQAARGNGFPVRVMSYNLHMGFDVEGRLGLKALAEVIEKERPDVLALQEVSRGWLIAGSVDMLIWLSQELEMRYVSGPTADSVWGNAVLSRYPLMRTEKHTMPNNEELNIKRGFIWVELDVGGEESLGIIATHLHAGTEEGQRRLPQVKAILDRWDGSEGTILLGDLNARPPDEEIEMLQGAGLLDAFVASGARGDGFTSRPNDPFQRIDYIWVSPDLEVRDFNIPRSLASDHFPIAATIYR